MKGKFFFELSLIFLLTGILVSGAMTQGILQINRQGVQILLSCQEDWSGSGYGTCANGIQSFICFDRNNCNTVNLKPVLCGTNQSCTVPASGGSSGGGDGGGSGGGNPSSGTPASTTSSNTGNVCTEQWNCTAWSDANNNCGTRVCTDKNNCGTILLKPAIGKSCSNGITGGAIRTITDFAQTPAGIISIVFIALVLLVVIITASQVKLKRLRVQEQAKQQETQQKPEEKPAKNKSAK
jgi:hypothetical protein